MRQIFCTLFDSNYLDKGLVLYDSMCRHIKEFTLYVVAFDDRAFEVLTAEKPEHLVAISLEEFETPALKKVKQERTRAEYCWTCSSWAIRYVLDHYGESECTYIDADMMFFSSPEPVFRDMREKQCSTLIVPHRFKTEAEEKKAHDEVGSYCVQFNTFLNNKDGREALDWWADKCLEWCFYAVPGTTEWYGDQKYLNVFPEKFKGVYICDHYGVGMAPWNNCLLEWAEGRTDGNGEYIPCVRVKSTGKVRPLVIYHFESMTFLTKHVLHASSNMKSKRLHREIYDVYVPKIIEKRNYIETKYGFHLSKDRRTVTDNPLLKLYHKYVLPIRKVKRLSDLYWVK